MLTKLLEIHKTESGTNYYIVPRWWNNVMVATIALALLSTGCIWIMAYFNMGRMARLEDKCLSVERIEEVR